MSQFNIRIHVRHCTMQEVTELNKTLSVSKVYQYSMQTNLMIS